MAVVRVSPITPAFAAQYALCVGTASKAEFGQQPRCLVGAELVTGLGLDRFVHDPPPFGLNEAAHAVPDRIDEGSTPHAVERELSQFRHEHLQVAHMDRFVLADALDDRRGVPGAIAPVDEQLGIAQQLSDHLSLVFEGHLSWTLGRPVFVTNYNVVATSNWPALMFVAAARVTL